MPVVNRETSLQIEASTNTFACKDTGKERIFRPELPASHTYHRYHHDVPSFLSRHAAHGNATLNVRRKVVVHWILTESSLNQIKSIWFASESPAWRCAMFRWVQTWFKWDSSSSAGEVTSFIKMTNVCTQADFLMVAVLEVAMSIQKKTGAKKGRWSP